MPIWLWLLLGGSAAVAIAKKGSASRSAGCNQATPGSGPATKEADAARADLLRGAAESAALRRARNEKAKNMFNDVRTYGGLYGAIAVEVWQAAVSALVAAGSLFHNRDSDEQIARAERVFGEMVKRGYAPRALDTTLMDAEGYGDLLQGSLDFIEAAGPFVKEKITKFGELRKKFWGNDLVDSITTDEMKGYGDFFNMFPKIAGLRRRPIFLAGKLLSLEYCVPEAPIEQAALDYDAKFDERHPGSVGNYVAENIMRLAEAFHYAELIAIKQKGTKVPTLRLFA